MFHVFDALAEFIRELIVDEHPQGHGPPHAPVGNGQADEFEVLEIDGDHTVVEFVEDTLGRYPFDMPLLGLVPVEAQQ
ncbi:hypothetical protein [Nocardia brevicatena]|uniref:hypothetical protein n=1 Tax=Nocardia brevicatena TaxID=37327 RepID=UPI000307D5AE|nr:hypothetical protein [Nocardia brevicatena]